MYIGIKGTEIMLAIARYFLALANQRHSARRTFSSKDAEKDVDTGSISSFISRVEEYYLHPDSDRVYAWAEA